MRNRSLPMSTAPRSRRLAAPAAALALLLLSACATPFQATVTRYSATIPAPGQSFVVEPAAPAAADGQPPSLEFETYAQRVSRNLEALGYRAAPSATEADFIARLSFGMGPPRDRLGTRPGPAFSSWGWYGRPFWGPGWHPWIGSRFYDPFWGGFGPTEVYSFTEFPVFAEVDLAPGRTARNVFEGRAEAAARRPDMPRVVPLLIDTIFVDFPGTSGEVRRVRVTPPSN